MPFSDFVLQQAVCLSRSFMVKGVEPGSAGKGFYLLGQSILSCLGTWARMKWSVHFMWEKVRAQGAISTLQALIE